MEYSKWPYSYKPVGLITPTDATLNPQYTYDCPPAPENLWPNMEPVTGKATNYLITPTYTSANNQDIMTQWALLLDGKYRENTLDAGIPEYVGWQGRGFEGPFYCYNFCLNTCPVEFQPTGAMNLSKFTNVEFEINVDPPPLDPSAQVQTVCDENGRIIGINKPNWRLYQYSYNLIVLEERYNVLTFSSGNAALMYAR